MAERFSSLVTPVTSHPSNSDENKRENVFHLKVRSDERQSHLVRQDSDASFSASVVQSVMRQGGQENSTMVSG